MMDRLRDRDLALLEVESPSTPMHNTTVEVFDPGRSDFDYDALVRLIDERISIVPRYRMRLQSVPAGLAGAVWVDDADFDLGFHVRRSALPRPGTMHQLEELVGRITARPLDRHRPLWEVYLVEGLEKGRFAVLWKSHQLLVDGVQTVDLSQVLLDVTAEPKRLASEQWQPRPRPGSGQLIADALSDNLRSPLSAVRALRSSAVHAATLVPGGRAVLGTVGGALRRSLPDSPVNGHLSEQRRFVGVTTDLADYRAIRRFHTGTVNDVILATISGALRSWLLTRDVSVERRRALRAMVPMSVIDEDLEPTSLGTQIAGHLLDLPIAEASPVIRLHQVSYAFKDHSATGRAVAANRLVGIAGFAPATFHALGSRVAFDQRGKGFHLSITNVPGPQFPLFAAGARMVATYPVQPLLPDHALSVGVTSYDGAVYYGINADRDRLPDVDLFAQCIPEALEELLETTSPTRRRARRGRRTPATPER